jgi:hypothetical protein
LDLIVVSWLLVRLVAAFAALNIALEIMACRCNTTQTLSRRPTC